MKLILMVLLMMLVHSSCVKDKTILYTEEVDVCADTVFFQDEIMGEIFDVSCNTAGCHDNATANAGYVLEDYSQISTNAAYFLEVMNHTTGVPMPYGGEKLADSLLQKMDCWIQQGKLNN